MFDSIIFHVDVNSAFLSWEAVHRLKHLSGTLDLREIPSAVGGDVKNRGGIILAKSIPAKKYGIKTGETLQEALRKCPDLKVVPPHYNLYDECSAAFFDILRSFAPSVEAFSVDEAYCDMTGTAGLYGPPATVAALIKDTIHKELGFTVNVGVSSNKLLAKMAGDFKKPNLVHTLFPSEIPTKMWPLPVSELFFVGRATAAKLFSLGIKTIGELAATDISILRSHLKKHGEILYLFANGMDPSRVIDTPPANKGYGNSTTIPYDINDPSAARLILLSLSETVGTRLRKDSVKIQVVAVSITYYDFTYASHQVTLFSASNETGEIFTAANRLFTELWNGMPVRKLGIHTSHAKPDDGIDQLTFYNLHTLEKHKRLQQAVDGIRDKYGSDAVMRAVFLNNPVCHMSGGVAREKLSVNYEEVNIE
jgi:DNA polymerase-4